MGISTGEIKTLIQKDSYIPIFIAALSTLANISKQQNAHQRINGQRKCGVYIQCLSSIKKRGNLAICNKDGPWGHHANHYT